MRRRCRWCSVAVLVLVCYCCSLLVGVRFLDAEQSRKSWTSEGSEHRAMRSSLCGENPGLSSSSSSCHNDRVMVVGALTLIGSRTAVHLAGQGRKVWAVVSEEDISTSRLIWYRWQQLSTAGVQVLMINTSNMTQTSSHIGNINPHTLIFVPPGLEGDHLLLPLSTPSHWGKYLEGFISILEVLRKHSTCTRVLMTSLSTLPWETGYHGSTLRSMVSASTRAWVETIELALATYHNLHGTPIIVLRTDGVYGPWGAEFLKDQSTPPQHCWYIGDVVKAIESALQLVVDCEVLDLGHCSVLLNRPRNHVMSLPEQYRHTWRALGVTSITPVEKGESKMAAWSRAYSREAGRNRGRGKRGRRGEEVIFTSYFTTQEDSQRHRHKIPNRFQYVSDWFLSVKALNMTAVVFHDGMDPGFQQRLSNFYSDISFHLVPSLNNRSTNDARFYAYLLYLHSHPEIHRVLLTDVSDVKFQRNPFELMRLLGDHLYVGTDIDIFPNMRSMVWLYERLQSCYGNHTLHKGTLSRLLELDTVYNAGVIGGSRHVMLAAISTIVQYLEVTPAQLNCNMPAVNFALHHRFFDEVFTGFPLTSRFLRHQVAPRGVFIVHK